MQQLQFYVLLSQSNRGQSRTIFETLCKPWIEKLLAHRTIHFYYTTSKQDTFSKTITAMEKDKASLLVSCGGEGTNNDVLNALLPWLKEHPSVSVAMAILPMGSCNDFAKTIVLYCCFFFRIYIVSIVVDKGIY